MIRITQTFGAHSGRVLELDREVIRFGRLPDNDLAFDPHADLDASGRHAEIRREQGVWVLVDVGSRNGTLVAGQKVTRHVLRSGDEVEFGVGGPRVRVEMPGRVPAETAQATPLGDGSSPGMLSAAGSVAPVGSVPPVSPYQQPTPPPSPFADPAGPMYPGQRSPAPTPMMGSNPGAMAPSAGGVGPPITGDPGSPKQFGQRTVGMMIQQALKEADATRSQSPAHSTGYMRAVATEAAQNSSRGLKVAVGALAFLLLLTLAGVIAVFFYARWQEEQLRDENVQLQEEMAELGEGETAERERLEERLQGLNEQIAEQQEAVGSRIANTNRRAVYALVRTRSNGRREVLCSAFSVRPTLLATSARCVGELESALGRADTVQVLPNGVGVPLSVVRLWRHPLYQASAPASPDVGLVRVSGAMPEAVSLSEMGPLTQLGPGDDVFMLGFPEAIADTGEAVAGMTSGVVGRVTAFDGTDAPPPQRHLVSHSAFTDGGTAGSPLFDRAGRVVAINAGNFRTRQRVRDSQTRVSRTVEGETPYAWAVRADLLLQLIAGLPPE
ncbi:MAG: FHA domain-containing protein [Sandaracinaceae bacterium]